MGWFSTGSTDNRERNTGQMIGASSVLNESKQQMERLQNFVQAQQSRATGLRNQVATTVSSSAYLGMQIQRAIDSLDSCIEDGHECIGELDEGTAVMQAIMEQYNVPRGARSLNASGRDMAGHARGMAAAAQHNLAVMKNKHEAPVRAAVITIDQIDRQINGYSASEAQYRIPRLD